MKFDLQKLDDRIKKLQELRKLATDPEMSTFLSEFLTEERDQSDISLHSKTEQSEPVAPSIEDKGQLVADVVRGMDPPLGSGLFRRRA